MTHEYSLFPDRVYTLHNFKNVADAPSEVVSIISDIKANVTAGKYSDAALLLQEYKSMLSPYWIDADIVNAIEEEVRNLEIYARGEKQSYYYQDNEPDALEGDVWIG